MSTGALQSAETPTTPSSKPGFFSRMVRPAEKSPEKSAPAEPPASTTKKTTPASGASQSAASVARQAPSNNEPKTSKKTPPKKSTDAKAEDELFNSARMRALEDPAIGDLRSKADKARDKESGIAATRTYLRGLYGKMRDLEPGLKERIDLTETAALQSLGRTP